jgi:hypothetical protein
MHLVAIDAAAIQSALSSSRQLLNSAFDPLRSKSGGKPSAQDYLREAHKESYFCMNDTAILERPRVRCRFQCFLKWMQ